MTLTPSQTRDAPYPIPFQTLIENTSGLSQGVPLDSELLASIAISLKRIADALTNTDPYSNPIAMALQNGISLGAQDWIGHMARNAR
jgi:hypothetical protein